MALKKRGLVWHYDFFEGDERYRGTTKLTNKVKAAAREAQIREDVRRDIRDRKLGIGPARAVATIGQVADQYFAARVVGLKSALTVAQRIKILFRHLDRDMAVNLIGAREVEGAMLSRRVEPIRQSPKDEARFPTNATVNRDIIDATLRPMLAYADEAMEEPVKRIRWAKLRLTEPKGRVRVFTAEELSAWRDAMPEWHRPVFDFMARYGARLAEVFFAPSAVNVEAGEIYFFDTKNGLDHTLPLLDEDIPAMAARKARATAAGLPTVWFRDEAGELTPIHWRGFQSASREALDRAGILNAKPAHDLRHHAATTLQRDTGNIKLVQELLNHQSIVSSARYAHASKADLKAGLRHTYATKPATDEKKPVDSTTGNAT